MSDPQADKASGGAGPAPLLHRVDLVVTLILLSICGFLYYVTTGFESVADMLAQNIPPEFFPRLVLTVIVILTLGLPFEHILHRRRGDDIDSGRRKMVKPMAYFSAGLLVALVFAMPYLGTFLTMIAACFLVPLLWGERRIKLIVPFAVLFPSAVTLLFTQALKVYFEPGFFGISFN